MKKRVLGFSNYMHPGSIFPFDDVFGNQTAIFNNQRELVPNLHSKVDAVVFWGGTDIHPAIYGQHHHPKSQAPSTLSNRDVDELKAMAYCKQHGIPMIGVCRGAQLGCAFAGGSLVQHCTGHHSEHWINVEKFPNIHVSLMATSEHHQMMNVAGTNHKLLAWSPAPRSTFYDGQDAADQITIEKEPEIVYFRDIKMLAIQGHPEWCPDGLDPFAQMCNLLIRQYLLEPEPVAA